LNGRGRGERCDLERSSTTSLALKASTTKCAAECDQVGGRDDLPVLLPHRKALPGLPRNFIWTSSDKAPGFLPGFAWHMTAAAFCGASCVEEFAASGAGPWSGQPRPDHHLSLFSCRGRHQEPTLHHGLPGRLVREIQGSISSAAPAESTNHRGVAHRP
jgi:hypothetical protein